MAWCFDGITLCIASPCQGMDSTARGSGSLEHPSPLTPPRKRPGCTPLRPPTPSSRDRGRHGLSDLLPCQGHSTRPRCILKVVGVRAGAPHKFGINDRLYLWHVGESGVGMLALCATLQTRASLTPTMCMGIKAVDTNQRLCPTYRVSLPLLPPPPRPQTRGIIRTCRFSGYCTGVHARKFCRTPPPGWIAWPVVSACGFAGLRSG